MTSLDRIIESLNLGSPSKIPVVPLVGIHSAKLAKVSVFDALRDGEKMAKAELSALDKYGYDGVFPFMDMTVEAEAMGCGIYEPEGEIPAVTEPIVKKPGDIEKLEVPDPGRDGRLPVFLKAVEEMSEKVGEDVAIFSYVTGPFTLASQLMEIKQFLMYCIRAPQLIHKLLKVTTRVGMGYGKALTDVGARVIMILEPLASQISPNHFEQFVVPHISQLADSIRKDGFFSILHICKNTSAHLDKMVKTGVNGISIDAPVDLKLMKEKLGSKVCVMGNVDSVWLMLNGSPEDVKKRSEECIKKAGGRGFILSSGCEIPKNTPPGNVEAMIKVVR